MKKLIIGIIVLATCTMNSSAVTVQRLSKINEDIGEHRTEFELIDKKTMYQRLQEFHKEPEIQWLNIIATAYTASADECGNDRGITASGTKVSLSRGTIAAPYDIPFYTKIMIPELDKEFIVEDRGNRQYIKRINDNTIRIDVYMKTKNEARAFGVKRLRGYIVK